MNKVLLLLVGLVLVTYLLFLGRSPVHLNQDELGFALNAYSINNNGSSFDGMSYPLYFRHLGEMWATPILVYSAALVLKVWELSEQNIRFVSVFWGYISVTIFCLCTGYFLNNNRLRLFSILLLITTPAFFIHSRLFLDNNIIVPFVLLWFLVLNHYLSTSKTHLLFWAGLSLGIGVHSYHAAKIAMPLFSILTIFTIVLHKSALRLKLIGTALVLFGFILPLLPLVPWLHAYPDTFIDQIQYTHLFDTSFGMLTGVGSLIQKQFLLDRMAIYLSYFSPGFLFSSGDNSLVHSTHAVGVFLTPLIILAPLGVLHVARNMNLRHFLLVMSIAVSPMAASLAGDRYRISRALTIIPFTILLAILGLSMLKGKKQTGAIVLVISLVFLQFDIFLYDYFKDYRIRSYEAFRYNKHGAFSQLINFAVDKDVDSVYLDKTIPFVTYYWHFYNYMYGTHYLIKKAYEFDPKNFDSSTSEKSLVLYYFHSISSLTEHIGGYQKIATSYESDGTSRFFVFYNSGE